jgi:hypothetical protein
MSGSIKTPTSLLTLKGIRLTPPQITLTLINEKMKNPCKMCNEWTPENGCHHFMPDSETVLLKSGYRIYKPGIDTRQKKFIVADDKVSHKFESLAKAASILIHNKKQPNHDNTK